MDVVLQLLLNGLAVGCIYGLVALGFVLIYKATELAWNSTHSESPDSEAPKGFIRLNNLAPIVTSYSVSKPQFTCVSSSVLSMHNLTD